MTISLESSSDRGVNSYLQNYLDSGWRVKEMRSVNGSATGETNFDKKVFGWLAVLLERGREE
ncbi:MAG: hypothetical protein H8D23_17665 [Candidatus Brocadiales bacterium]|nr:hypothetical protein [Candidatus Brocadiales bacterium]